MRICREIAGVAIYALYLESFCCENLAIRKVFAFSDSAKRPLLRRGDFYGMWQPLCLIKLLQHCWSNFYKTLSLDKVLWHWQGWSKFCRTSTLGTALLIKICSTGTLAQLAQVGPSTVEQLNSWTVEAGRVDQIPPSAAFGFLLTTACFDQLTQSRIGQK